MTKITLEDFLGDWTPGSYRVFCYVEPTKKNRLDTPMLQNPGNAFTIEKARELIAEDKAAMSNTFGGLIDASPVEGRHYRIFHAEAWTAVE